jgi:signal peptidase I
MVRVCLRARTIGEYGAPTPLPGRTNGPAGRPTPARPPARPRASAASLVPSRLAGIEHGPAFPTAGAALAGGLRSALRDVVPFVLLTLFLCLAVRASVQTFAVQGASMAPSLRSGQYLFIDKIGYWRLDRTPLEGLVRRGGAQGDAAYLLGGPQRGDIVVFRSPIDPDRDLIKRVIAAPGDTVEVRGGQVYVSGATLDEPYIRERPGYSLAPRVVPAGHYFVLGDNRNNSEDSHIWGFLPAENLIGRARVTLWPLNLLGALPTPSYAQ